MKSIILFFLITLSSLKAQLSSFEMDMAPEDPEPSSDFIRSLIIEDDKYTFLANTSCQNNTLGCLAFGQISKEGKLINFKKYSFDLPININSNNNFKKLNDGSYIISADLYEDRYVRYPILIKLDSKGDSLWTRRYKTNNPLIDIVKGLEVLINGGYLLATYGFTSSQGDVGLIRCDSFGELIWAKTVGLVSKYKGSLLTSMKALSNDNILISFISTPYLNQGTDGNNFAILDSTGKLITEYRISKYYGYSPYIYPLTDTTFFYACPTDTFIHGNGVNLIHGIINNSGTKLSEFAFPSPEAREATGLTKFGNGTFFLFGLRDNWEFGLTAYWISKHASNGELIWEKSFLEKSRMFTHMPGLADLDIEKDSTIIASGAIRDTIQFGFVKQNAYILRLNQNGCFNHDTCSEKNLITVTEDNLKKSINSAMVFPNPSINSVNFIFNFFDLKQARFLVVDLLNKVNIDKSIWIANGKYEDSLEGLKSGIYFYKFSTNNKLFSGGKIIKL